MVDLSSLGRLHIATATIGIAIFSLATMVAIIYLLQERNLKRKNFDGVLFKASASLETLELLSRRLVAIGFPIFTISMILGTIWAAQLRHGFDRIEWPLSIVTWLTFGGLVLGLAPYAATETDNECTSAIYLVAGAVVAVLRVTPAALAASRTLSAISGTR